MCAACGGVSEALAKQALEGAVFEKFEFSVPGVSCGSCVARIERHFNGLEGVRSARMNLTLKRLVVEVAQSKGDAFVLEQLRGLSFEAHRIDEEVKTDDAHERAARGLLRALAVAGFGAANIMLLSVSAWSGADGVTRDLFHLISAAIAVPVVAYSGQPFFRSALQALRAGHVNMDFPISLAVLLALGMSIFQTMASEETVYFDAAVMLLFFLLIGRYLDQLMRARARSAVISLSQYAARYALEIKPDGSTREIPVSGIEEGMTLRILPGGRVPVNATVLSGKSEIDRSMITGESDPVPVEDGTFIEGGTLNLTGVLNVRADSTDDTSFLAEIRRMLEAAEQTKSRYVRIADRAARVYTPVVHMAAFTAFAGWMLATGGDWHTSLLVAIAVLIITCPCALGLAVPVAHVVAASQLFSKGLLLRNGAALERLAKVDLAFFDKTGTVTNGIKTVVTLPPLSDEQARVFATLASHSNHPVSMAIVRALTPFEPVVLEDSHETAGLGISALWQGKPVALRKAQSGTQFVFDGQVLGHATFEETLRADARPCLEALGKQGIDVALLSGDTPTAVSNMAVRLGIKTHYAHQTPGEKLDRIETARARQGRGVLMVGDGINDAPSLAAADVSIAPSSAADVGRQAADFVMTRESLSLVPQAIAIARQTDMIVRQNFAIAICYNCIAVPLAFAGIVTPLVAALAMSGSSIVVITNSLRIAWQRGAHGKNAGPARQDLRPPVNTQPEMVAP
ncbi:MAG: heavy metal translocating P-type ATPase [Pseudomonadota bacterium]